MNALYFYRSFLKKVRSQLGESAYLHMNSPLQCNFFPCNATYFTRIKVNVCYVSVDIFMADVFYINFGKNVFSFIIFFCNQGHTFCDMSSLRGSALRTFLYQHDAPIFCLNWWSTKAVTMSPKSVPPVAIFHSLMIRGHETCIHIFFFGVLSCNGTRAIWWTISRGYQNTYFYGELPRAAVIKSFL